jgi:hypothetical protein
VVQIGSPEAGLGLGGEVKRFAAIGCAARWPAVMAPHRRAVASAARLLGKVAAAVPFPVAAFQIDGGAEFMAEHAAACAARRLPLRGLPPEGPGRDGRGERIRATRRHGFRAPGDPPHRIEAPSPGSAPAPGAATPGAATTPWPGPPVRLPRRSESDDARARAGASAMSGAGTAA